MERLRTRPRLISLGDPYLDGMLGGAPRGSLIVVAGRPGTGKTIFSSQLAYVNMRKGLRAAYLSLAEPRGFFLQCMKKLGMDFKRMEERGLFNFYDLASPKDPSFTEKMLGEALKEVMERASDILIVDSLGALLQLTGLEKARSLIHTLFSRVTRTAGVTTVAVAEIISPEGTIGVEGFIADVVILLSKREIEARLARQLEVVKARGARVSHPRLLFTLHGGFKVVAPFQPLRVVEPRRFEPLEDPPGRYSTGSSALDEIFGGYPRGGVVFIEIGENVGTQMYHTIVVPTLANFAVKGRGVMIFPSMGIDARVVCEAGRMYGIGDEEFKKQVRCVQFAPPHPGAEDWVLELRGKDFEEDYQRWIESLKSLQRVTGRKEVVAFVGMDSLHSQYGEDSMYRFLSLEAFRTRIEEGLLIIAVKPGLKERIAKLMANPSDLRLKLVRRRGALLLYGLLPRTELYAVSMDVSKGYPLPKLTPIT